MARNIIEETKNIIQEKKSQIAQLQQEEKTYPPSDQKLNKCNFVVSNIAVAVLALYFILCGILSAAGVGVPYYVFTFAVAPIEILLLGSGITMSVLQLVRHRYPRIKLCITLQVIAILVCFSYVAVVAGCLGWGALIA